MSTEVRNGQNVFGNACGKCHGDTVGVCGTPTGLLVWRKPKEGGGKNDRFLGGKCIVSNGFTVEKKGKALGLMKTERNQIVTYDLRGNECAKYGGKHLLVERSYCAYLQCFV